MENGKYQKQKIVKRKSNCQNMEDCQRSEKKVKNTRRKNVGNAEKIPKKSVKKRKFKI